MTRTLDCDALGNTRLEAPRLASIELGRAAPRRLAEPPIRLHSPVAQSTERDPSVLPDRRGRVQVRSNICHRRKVNDGAS